MQLLGDKTSKRSRAMKTIALLIAFIGMASESRAQHQNYSMPHEMQHGFILAVDDSFASHLVATGHHSRQTYITGHLTIEDPKEYEIYNERKFMNSDSSSYFLFQAQALDLPSLQAGQILNGHIVESKVGKYEPKNVIVKRATFQVDKVLLNIENPFFGDH